MADVPFDTVKEVFRVLGASGLTDDDCLLVCELAWIAMANNLRTAALSFPGGFTDARAMQVDRLQKLAELVAADVPDLEAERLLQEGDLEGYMAHIRKLMK